MVPGSRAYPHLHSDEYQGYLRYASHPVGKHLAAQHAHGIRQVLSQNQKPMTVDCILCEYVGPTLKQVFGQTVANSDEVVRYFMKLLLMIQRLTDAKIEWQNDFHADNISYDMQSGVWKMIDLEKIETATTLTSKCNQHRCQKTDEAS